MNSHQINNIPEIKYIEIEFQTKTNYAKETFNGHYYIYEINFALSESILPDSIVNIGRNKYEIFYQQKKESIEFWDNAKLKVKKDLNGQITDSFDQKGNLIVKCFDNHEMLNFYKGDTLDKTIFKFKNSGKINTEYKTIKFKRLNNSIIKKEIFEDCCQYNQPCPNDYIMEYYNYNNQLIKEYQIIDSEIFKDYKNKFNDFDQINQIVLYEYIYNLDFLKTVNKYEWTSYSEDDFFYPVEIMMDSISSSNHLISTTNYIKISEGSIKIKSKT